MTEYKIFDSIQEPVLVLDENLGVQYGNQAAGTLFDVSVKRLRSGKPIANFLNFSPDPFAETPIIQIEEASQYRELDYTTTSGKEGSAQISFQFDPGIRANSDDSAQGLKRWVVFFRDVTLEKVLANKYKGELDQKEAVIDDLKKAREQLEDYSKNLEKMVEARTAELRAANRLMSAILDSLGQGILVFDSQGQCLPFVSRVCADILENVPRAGQNVAEVLGLKANAADEFTRWCSALFGEMLPFEDLAALGPSEFKHSKGRFIGLTFNPMRDANGSLEGIVLVATDRTAEVTAKQEAANERSFARRIVQVVKHRQQFRSYVGESNTIYGQLKGFMSSKTPWNFEEVARHLHTIKGGSSSFSLTEIANLAHHAEQELIQCKSARPDELHGLKVRLQGDINKMETSLSEFLSANAALLGGTVESSGRQIEVSVEVMRNWQQQLTGIKQFEAMSRVAYEILNNYLREPIAKSFSHIDQAMQDLAANLGKKIAPLQIIGGDLRIIPENYSELFATLIHGFRNAVDHGLEAPDYRVLMKKNEAGSLRLKFEKINRDHVDYLRIEIEDDGRGIDPQKIRDKIRQKGLSESLLELPDEEVIQVVFRDDFSTAETVTTTSGRGVGLSAVKFKAEELGGSAHVNSSLGHGSRLVVEVLDQDFASRIQKATAA